MYSRDMDWQYYLAQRDFNDKVADALERQTTTLAVGQLGQVFAQVMTGQLLQEGIGAVLANQDRTNDLLAHGLGGIIGQQREMTTLLRNSFFGVRYELNRVQAGIDQLRSSFDWAMGTLLWKLEMQDRTLRSLVEALQAPLDTQARELRQRAEFAYLNGWYDEALRDFLLSAEKNYQDFAVHQAIGNIYLYKQNPPDLDNALSYYLAAGKYASPRSSYHAALAYMHAGFVSYLERHDDDAIAYARRATELHPDLTEPWFSLAKFAAAAQRPDIAIPSLDRIIRLDRNYAVKVSFDQDFAGIVDEVALLMDRLRAEAREVFMAAWMPLEAEMSRYRLAPEERAQIDAVKGELGALLAQNTYFGYLDAPALIPTVRAAFDGLRVAERDAILTEAVQRLDQLKGEIAEYVMPKALDLRLNRDILHADQTLSHAHTFADAVAAKETVEECVHLLHGSVLEGHSDRIDAIMFSLDSEVLVSLARSSFLFEKRPIRMWDVKRRSELGVSLGFGVEPRGILFSPDGRLVAVALADKSIRLVDFATRDERAKLDWDGNSDIRFSPDGKMLAAAMGQEVVVWDVVSAQQRGTLKHSNGVYTFRFSPDGKMLAAATGKEVVVWDVVSAQQRGTLKHSDSVNTLNFSPDSRMLATGTGISSSIIAMARLGRPEPKEDLKRNCDVYLWNVRDCGDETILKGHTDAVGDVRFTPDGSTLASRGGDHTVRLWDVSRRKERACLVRRVVSELIASDKVSRYSMKRADLRAMELSPDGRTLATVGDEGIYLWDVSTGDLLGILEGHYDWYARFTFAPNGQYLASIAVKSSYDQCMVLWDYVNMRPVAVQSLAGSAADHPTSITFSPNGEMIAVGFGKVIHVWNMAGLRRDLEDYHRYLAEWQQRAVRRQEAWERQCASRRVEGRCENCGEKMSFVERMGKQTLCKKCRQQPP